MTHRIEPGQIYQRYNAREHAITRIRIESLAPDGSRAWVVDADTGKLARWVKTANLHTSPYTRGGQPRRTGYVLEQP
ncbi:hypothetical protein [Streptomyces achromogenes]|uniref:hypothetical protein n=1 Tax=Streptomyces achromogenes TaxID=67255 RepID=UPI003422F90A